MRLAAEYFESMKTGTTVVAPSARISRMLIGAYNVQMRASGAAAWSTPDILPWDAWTSRLYEACEAWPSAAPRTAASFLLSRDQERALWERVIADSGQFESAHVARLASLAMDAWSKMHHWQLDPANLFASPVSPGVAAFQRWCREFVSACNARRGIDRVRAAVALAGADHGSLSVMRRPVVLHGFPEQTPIAEKIIENLTAAGFRFSEPHVPCGPGQSVFRSFGNVDDEVYAAACWSRELALADPDADVVVVVSELDRLRSMIRTVFSAVLAPETGRLDQLPGPAVFQISGDGPLLESAMIRSALAILKLSGRSTWQAVSALLRSPHLGSASTEQDARALLDLELRRDKGVEISVDVLIAAAKHERFACHDFAERIRTVAEIRANSPPRQSLNAWAAHIDQTLDAAGWPGDAALSETERAVLDAWQRVLESLASLDAVLGDVGRDQAVKELCAVLHGSRTDEPPPTPIQIVTPAEALALQPAHTWVSGVHDGAWPPRKDPNPLLAYRIQRNAGVPAADPETDTKRARALLKALVDGAPASVFSYSTAENETPLRPSPLVAAHFPEHVEAATHEWPAAWSGTRGSVALERIDDAQGPPMPRHAPVRGGVSLFTDQAACPFRGFARHRLGARSIEDPTPGLDARKRGELIHRILEGFWTSVPSQAALLALSDAVLRRRVSACVDRAMARLMPRIELGQAFWDIEHERLTDLMLESLQMEQDRSPFEVVATELPQSLRCGEIEINMRVDRIDRLQDGGEAMIDYKTGRAVRVDWSVPRPDRPQLPLYALNRAHGRVAGIAYARIGKGNFTYVDEPRGILTAPRANAESEAAWHETLSDWQREMQILAGEAAAGYAAIDPKHGPKTCRQCDLQVLCRVHEQLGAFAPDD